MKKFIDGILLPGVADKVQQLDAARQMLKSHETSIGDRCHAACFMIYREADKDITPEESANLLTGSEYESLPDGKERVRWESSIRTAVFFRDILLGDGPWRTKGFRHPLSPMDLERSHKAHPSIIINWARAYAVIANLSLLEGNLGEAAVTCSAALDKMLQLCAVLDWRNNALRIYEMRSDWHVMSALMRMYEQAKGEVTHAPWATTQEILKCEGHLHWMRCMRRMSVAAKKMWE